MYPQMNFNVVGYDAYVDDDGVFHPGGGIEHIPGRCIIWEAGLGTVRMSCQKCHPVWTGNEAQDPECDLCGGEGHMTRTIKTQARIDNDARNSEADAT